MLTKEESNKFYEALGGMFIEKGCNCLLDWRRMQDLIEKCSEKPKRKIQVGDIYRNKYGCLKEIRDIDMSKERPLRATFTSYRLDGQYLTSEPSKDDLDLSKRYELTEVEDVD